MNIDNENKYKDTLDEWHREDEQNLNACLGYISDEYLRRWLKDIIHVKYDNPTDKVEPKFKVKDWITNGQLTCRVLGVIGKSYELHLYNDDYCHFETDIQSVDKDYHLWSIKDAKDGDVLASELCCSIILYKGIEDNNIQFYCDFDFSEIDVPGDRFSINNGQHYGNVEDSKDFHPATKEQRDLIFQKIKETGYEWNIELSDEHPSGGAMLHVLDKGVEIGKKQAFEKVNEFLKTFNIDNYISTIISGCCSITFMREKFIEDLKKTLQDESR